MNSHQEAALANVWVRADRLLPKGDQLWIEPYTPAGRVSIGLSVNL